MTNKIDNNLTSSLYWVAKPISNAIDSAVSLIFSQKPKTIPPGQLAPPPVNLDRAGVLIEMGAQIDRFNVPNVVPSDIDWNDRTEKELKKFVDKASMMSIVMMMNPDTTYSDALEIVNQAYVSKKSLFSVFKEFAFTKKTDVREKSHQTEKREKLSFFAKVKSGLIYFFLYRCGILNDTLEMFMRTILRESRFVFQADGGTRRIQMLDKVLEHARSFLEKKRLALIQIKQNQNPALAKDPAVRLDEILNPQTNEEKLKLCTDFTRTAIREFLPDIPVLPQWKNHRNVVVRLLAALFLSIPERIFNRILRTQIEKHVPAQMANLWTTSIHITQESNPTFLIAMTKTLKNRFLEAKPKLSKPDSEPDEPIAVPPGTKKKIEEVVQLLLQMLRGDQTANLGQRLISSTISQSIESAMVEGCHSLCKVLSDMAESDELYAKLLELSNIVFDPNVSKTHKELHDEFLAEEKEMRKAAREVFQTVIHRAVKNKTHRLTPVEILTRADQVSNKQRAVNDRSMDQLIEISDAIKGQLQSPDSDLSTELNKISTVCARVHTESTNADYSDLPLSLQRGIEESMKPIEWNLTLILEETKSILAIERERVSDRASAREAAVLRQACEDACNFYATSCKALQDDSINLSDELSLFSRKWADLRQTMENIAAARNPNDPKREQTRGRIAKLDRLYDDIQKMQATLSHLLSLRKFGEDPTRNRGGFFPFHTAAHIQFHFRSLPQEYSARLAPLSRNLPHPAARRKWQEAWQSIAKEQIGQLHRQQQILLIWSDHAKRSFETYRASSAKHHQSCLAYSEGLAAKLSLLSDATKRLQIKPIPTLQDKVVDFFQPNHRRILGGAAITAAAHMALSYAGYPWLATGVNLIGGAIAGGLSLYSRGISRAPKKVNFRDHALTAAPWAAAAAVGSAALATIPGAGKILSALPAGITGAYMGQNAMQGLETFSESLAYQEVSQTFDSLYDFILQRHVWKWAIKEMFSEINRAYN